VTVAGDGRPRYMSLRKARLDPAGAGLGPGLVIG
jgi:hypothetical protein